LKRASVAPEVEEFARVRDNPAMETTAETTAGPRLLSAERLDNAVVITFDDGKCSLYSAALLYSILPQAKEIEPEDE
jgi:hypothetical protein